MASPLKRSVLVVEDEPLLRDLYATALESHGFQAFTAASAADARRTFQQVQPDALLVDIHLGAGQNGFDLAVDLRKQEPSICIVFLTNITDPRFVSTDQAASIPSNVAYLKKSAISSVEDLVSVLDETLRGGSKRPVRHDLDVQPFQQLTQKQVDVLQQIADGMTNNQIATSRGITVKATEDLIRRTFIALGLDASVDGNLRVAAVRKYFEATASIRPRT